MKFYCKILSGEQKVVPELTKVSLQEARDRFKILFDKHFSSQKELNAFLSNNPELNNLIFKSPNTSLSLAGRQVYNNMAENNLVETRIIGEEFLFIVRNSQKTKVCFFQAAKDDSTQIEIIDKYSADFYLNIQINLIIMDLRQKLREGIIISDEELSSYLEKKTLLHTLEYKPRQKRYTEFAGDIMQHHAQAIDRVVTLFFEKKLLILTYGFNKFKQAADIWLGVLKRERTDFNDIGVISLLEYGATKLIDQASLDVSDEETKALLKELIRYDQAYTLFNKIRRESRQNIEKLIEVGDANSDAELNTFLLKTYPELIGLEYFSPTDRGIHFIIFRIQHQFKDGAFVKICQIENKCILVISNKTQTKHLAAYLNTKNKGTISLVSIPDTSESSIINALHGVIIPRLYFSIRNRKSPDEEPSATSSRREITDFQKALAWLGLKGLTKELRFPDKLRLSNSSLATPAQPKKAKTKRLSRESVESTDPLLMAQIIFDRFLAGLQKTFNASLAGNEKQYKKYELEEFCSVETLEKIKSYKQQLLETSSNPEEIISEYISFMADLRSRLLNIRYEIVINVFKKHFKQVTDIVLVQAKHNQKIDILRELSTLNFMLWKNKENLLDWELAQVNLFLPRLESTADPLYAQIINEANDSLDKLKETLQI